MVSRWRKLNHLVPEPKCRMKENEQGVLQIIEWTDERSQPTDAEIDAVDDAAVNASEADKEKDNLFETPTIKAVMSTMLFYTNELRTLQSLPDITNQEAKDKVKSFLP